MFIFKKMQSLKPILLIIAFMGIVFSICKGIENTKKVPNNVHNQKDISHEESMRAVWVSYLEFNISSEKNTEKAFKDKFSKIIEDSKKHKINTLIVQVRAFSDSLYKSNIFPWSHILTGEQGKDPNFDPLKYMIEESHKNGIKLHAWINPFRVKLKENPKALSKNNPYYKFDKDKHFINHSSGICFNPAYEKVRNLIIEGVKEIVKNYSVDGIHFDDYFYPENGKDIAYEEHCKENPNNHMSELVWRKNNVNMFIRKTYSEIKKINPNVIFGISPAGNINNCYRVGADVKRWLSEKGYVDYLVPQIYWSLNFKLAPFEKIAKNWKDIHKNKNIKLYGGLALYKIGTNLDLGTWKCQRNNILASESKILKKLGYSGYVLFSYRFLNMPVTKSEIQNLDNDKSFG